MRRPLFVWTLPKGEVTNTLHASHSFDVGGKGALSTPKTLASTIPRENRRGRNPHSEARGNQRITVKLTVFTLVATWKEWLIQGEKGDERDVSALATAILIIAK